MTTIEWRDPPQADSPPRRSTARFVAALKDRPGSWALYGNYASNNSTNLTRSWPGTEWRFHKTDGRFDIYARWIGDA